MPSDLVVSMVRIKSWDMQSFATGLDAYAPFALLSELGVVRSEYEEAAPLECRFIVYEPTDVADRVPTHDGFLLFVPRLLAETSKVNDQAAYLGGQ